MQDDEPFKSAALASLTERDIHAALDMISLALEGSGTPYVDLIAALKSYRHKGDEQKSLLEDLYSSIGYSL